MTFVMEFSAPNRPLSENEKRKMRHWAQWRRRLDPWKDATKAAWLASSAKDRKKIKDVGVNVLVELPFERKSRRDPHNYVGTNVKTIIDALTTKVDTKSDTITWDGAWPDDTPEWVTVLEPVLTIGTDVARVHLIPRED
jgi:hypothetical protein